VAQQRRTHKANKGLTVTSNSACLHRDSGLIKSSKAAFAATARMSTVQYSFNRLPLLWECALE